MLTRFVTLCIIGIFILLVAVGYKVYQTYTELEDIRLEIEPVYATHTETTQDVVKRGFVNREVLDSPTGPQAVGQISTQKINGYSPQERIIENPLKYNSNLPMDAVEFRPVKTPDGLTVEMPFPKGAEIVKPAGQTMNDDLPNGVKRVSVISTSKRVPPGEDLDTFLVKNLLSDVYDISMQEVDERLAKGELGFASTSSSRMSVQEWIESRGGKEKVKSLFNDAGVSASQTERLLSPSQSIHEIDFADVHDNSADHIEVPQVFRTRAEFDNSVGETSNERPPASTENNRGETDLENQSIPEDIDVELSKRVSPDRFDEMQRLIKQYGTEEGLRRFREIDPEAARQFERHPPNRPASGTTPSRDTPNSEESER